MKHSYAVRTWLRFLTCVPDLRRGLSALFMAIVLSISGGSVSPLPGFAVDSDIPAQVQVPVSGHSQAQTHAALPAQTHAALPAQTHAALPAQTHAALPAQAQGLKAGAQNFEIIWLEEDFDIFSGFREGLAAVSKDGRWGYIDMDGTLVVPLIYEFADDFSEGFARVGRDGKFGFVNSKGVEVIPCIYYNAFYFREGLAQVMQYGEDGVKCGFVDASGNEVIAIVYDSAENFVGGTARVEKAGKFGFVNRKGEEVIPCIYDAAAKEFRGGLVPVVKEGYAGYGKWGYIDKSGNEVIPFVYDPPVVEPLTPLLEELYQFENGLARVKKEGKWGCIDVSGKEVVPFVYDYIDFPSRGSEKGSANSLTDAPIKARRDGKTGFIDRSGREVIPFIYEGADAFSEGTAGVLKDGNIGFINQAGEAVSLFVYDSVGVFREGFAKVKKNGKYGFVDRSGREVIPCKYDEVEDFCEGMASVSRDGKYGFVSGDGGEAIACIYERTSSAFSGGAVWAVKDGKVGFLDKTGRVTLSFDYDYALDFRDGYAIVKKDGKRAILRAKSKSDSSGSGHVVDIDPSSAVAGNEVFSDIGDQPSEMQEAIRALASEGIVRGVGEGRFNPDVPISRAEIAMLLLKLLSKYDEAADGGFSDVRSGDWYFGAVGSVKRLGLMSGTGSGAEGVLFSPKASITREQMAAVSARILRSEKKQEDPANVEEILAGFADGAEIPIRARFDVALVAAEGLIRSGDDGRFNPAETVTRGDAAVTLYRLIQKLR